MRARSLIIFFSLVALFTSCYLIAVFFFSLLSKNKDTSVSETQAGTDQDTHLSGDAIDPSASSPAERTSDFERGIAQLSAWLNSPLALAQQHELYEAIAKIPVEDFPAVVSYLSDQEVDLKKEASLVLNLRWMIDAPLNRIRYQYSQDNADLRLHGYSAEIVIPKSAEQNLSATVSLLRELGEAGASLFSEYENLYNWLSQQPAGERDSELIAFLQAAIAEHRIGSQKAPPNRAVSAETVLSHLISDPSKSATLFTQLAMQDIQTAMDLILSLENPNTHSVLISTALPILARQEPRQTVQLISELQDTADQVYTYSNALSTALESDPSALDYALSQIDMDNPSGSKLLNLVMSSNAATPALLPLINLLPPSHQKRNQINRSLRILAQDGFEKADKWIEENLNEEEASIARLNTISLSFQQDPAQALAYLENAPRSQTRHNAIRQLAQHRSTQDLEGTLVWINALDDERDRSTALEAIAYNWVASDIESAELYLSKATSSTAKLAIQRAIGSHYSNYQSPAETLRVLAEMDDPTPVTYAYNRAIGELASVDPLAALEQIRSGNIPASIEADAIDTLARSWATRDPRTASKKLLSQPGVIAEKSLPALIRVHLDFDPEGLHAVSKLIETPELQASFEVILLRALHRKTVDPVLYEALTGPSKGR